MTDKPDIGTRILVGASSFVDARAALLLIARLMHEWRPCLGGILIEDATSLAICRLPNQRIVTDSGALALAPTLAEARTLIDADARAFRQSLAHLADDVGVPWSFEREIGDLIQQGLHTAAAWDIMVFAHRNIHAVTGKVVLLRSAQPEDTRIDDLSRILARNLSADRLVLTVDAAAARTQAGSTLATLEDALARLARINAQVVLVDLTHGPVHSADDLRALIDAARCPVFVFGMTSALRVLEHTMQIPPSSGSQGPDGGC